MQPIKIIIGQGNGISDANATRQIIEQNFPTQLEKFFISHNEDVVVDLAQKTPDCIVLLGKIWGGRVFGDDIAIATRIKLVNQTAKVYQYVFDPSKDYYGVFNGIFSKVAPDNLVSFIAEIFTRE